MIIAIKENSRLAKLAARRLKTENMALVIGKTIHLYNTSKKNFLENEKWVKHEIIHVKQYQQHGIMRFLLLYFFEWIKNGYAKNRFEIEARNGENSEMNLPGCLIL